MNILAKIQELVKKYQSDLILVGCVVMLTIISFNLGKISAYSRSSAKSSTQTTDLTANSGGIPSISGQKTSITHTDLSVVASKKSKSKLYHFSWCAGTSQISDTNKLTFATEAEAIAAGYKLASNCTK